MLGLRLRWALRDARARWLQVGAIALMIAIGAGMYSGLSSTTQWRFASNEAQLRSYEHVRHPRPARRRGPFSRAARWRPWRRGIEGVELVEERLIVQTQVDVDAGDRSIFAARQDRGRGTFPTAARHVNGVETLVGRPIEESEAGEPGSCCWRATSAPSTSCRKPGG